MEPEANHLLLRLTQASTSSPMVLRICTPPTSRQLKGLTVITPLWRPLLVTVVLSRTSLAPHIPRLYNNSAILCYSCDISGGTIAGMVSQHIGRRLTIIVFVLISGAFIPLWILPSSFGGLSAGAFWLQFGVQGAWGVIPIQLAEMSPPGFRATFPGVTYQLGNVSTNSRCRVRGMLTDLMLSDR